MKRDDSAARCEMFIQSVLVLIEEAAPPSDAHLLSELHLSLFSSSHVQTEQGTTTGQGFINVHKSLIMPHRSALSY